MMRLAYSLQLPLLLLLAMILTLMASLAWQTTAVSGPADVNDPLPRIVCSALPGETNVSYTATVYATGLSGPDGLAFGPDDLLYASEERGGRVVQIGATGQITAVLTGLTNPEGLTFDPTGNLYVVEDTASGRLIQRTPSGITTTLTTALNAPEGITIGADGRAYVTESELELLPPNPDQNDILGLKSYLTAVDTTAPYTLTRRYTATAVVLDPIPPQIVGTFNSFAGITTSSDGLLYVTNELSGVELVTTTVVNLPLPTTITATFTSTASIFALDPTAVVGTAPTQFASNLTTPEGLTFTPTDFPLIVAEEDSSGASQLGTGRLSLVDSKGTRTTFCTGFQNIEDVTRDESGNFYVSEDSSGLIIKLERTSTPVLNGVLYLPYIEKP
jgi:sugar lactone lactonase YvrE